MKEGNVVKDKRRKWRGIVWKRKQKLHCGQLGGHRERGNTVKPGKDFICSEY